MPRQLERKQAKVKKKGQMAILEFLETTQQTPKIHQTKENVYQTTEGIMRTTRMISFIRASVKNERKEPSMFRKK